MSMPARRRFKLREIYARPEESPKARRIRLTLTAAMALGAAGSLVVAPIPSALLLAYVALGLIVGGIGFVEGAIAGGFAMLLLIYGVGAVARVGHDPSTASWQPYLIAAAVTLLVFAGPELMQRARREKTLMGRDGP